MLFNFSEMPSLIVTLVVFVWLGAATFLLTKVLKTFSRLTKGVDNKDLKQILEELLNEIKKRERNQR